MTTAAVQLRISPAKFALSVPELRKDAVSPFVPTAIANVSRIRTVPFVLAGVLAALALLTVSHVMVTSIRTRRRDLAILRSLGADGGWITRAVHWQATVLTIVPVVLGLPIGIVVGRLVFLAFADSMGAVDDAAIPFAVVAIGAVAVVFLANAIAVVTSRAARRSAPAVLLQGE